MKKSNLLILPAMSCLLLFTSCKKSDTPKPDDVGNPVTLDCSYFDANPGTTLKNTSATIDYIVTCKMSINSDIKIEAGTTIAFETDAGFKVNESGSLSMTGTTTAPITLTGTNKAKGSWAGVIYYSNSSNNKMNFVNVKYAGGDKFNSNNDRGAIIVYANGRLNMSNSTISNSETYGFNASYLAELTFNSNSYKNNNIPIVVTSPLMGMLSPTDDFLGNENDYVQLTCYTQKVEGNVLMKKLNVPYRVVRNSSLATINIDGDLTIEAGTKIENDNGVLWRVEDGASLKAIGTSANPIIMTGAQSTNGYWKGIRFDYTTNPNNILENVKIMYAGNDPTNTKGAIYMWAKPMLKLTNVSFSDVASCAIYGAPSSSNPNPNLTVSGLSYTNCAGEICGD